MAKNKNPLLEPEHYAGWALVTGAIVMIFHYIDISLYNPWYNTLILFVIIAIIDTLNHFLKIQ